MAWVTSGRAARSGLQSKNGFVDASLPTMRTLTFRVRAHHSALDVLSVNRSLPIEIVVQEHVHDSGSMLPSARRSSTASLPGCIGSAPMPIMSSRQSGTALTWPPVSEKKAVALPG